MDPTLSLSGRPSIILLTAEVPPACQSPYSTSSLVVVAEGIPPIPHKLVEKIRKWEYVDLASLLDVHDHSTADQVAILNGQLTVVNATSQRRCQKNISDILTWLQAFAIFTAILVSSDATTKEEAAGLVAHSVLIMQLSKDLSGPQWLKFDQGYCEWAAAKGIRKWGEMNFSIYGCCLAAQQSNMSYPLNSSNDYSWKRKANSNVCFQWNDGASCSSSACRFLHRCRACGGNHCGTDCPRQPRRL